MYHHRAFQVGHQEVSQLRPGHDEEKEPFWREAPGRCLRSLWTRLWRGDRPLGRQQPLVGQQKRQEEQSGRNKKGQAMEQSEGWRQRQEGNSQRKADATEENQILGLILKYLDDATIYLNCYILNSNPSRLSFVTVWNAWSLFILVQCEFIFGLCCWCGFTETQYCIYPVCNDEENLYWHTCWTVSIHILPQSQTCSLLIHQLCAFLWSFSLVDFCAASYSIGPIGIGFLAVNGSHSPPFPVEL